MTDKHEYLRKAHQAANDFKYGYVTISNSALGALLAERDALREALEMMVKVGEMNGTGRAYAMKVARAVLAQEYRHESKVTMPEPDAYLYVNGEHRGVSLNFRSDMELSDGTVRNALITTDQAKAYADARVQGALEKAESILRGSVNICKTPDLKELLSAHADAIHSLISKEQE